MPTRHSGFLIQSRHGQKGNFELVAPRSGGGMVHWWRNNDAGGYPWIGPNTALPTGNVSATALLQSNFGSIGNLEVIAVIGGKLNHLWRQDHSPWTWSTPGNFSGLFVRGAPGFIQSNHGTRGNFEVVAPLAEGGLGHWWRNNDAAGLPWSGGTRFGTGLYYDAAALIQSNFGPVGNLEVVARLGDRLVHFWRDDGRSWAWNGPYEFARGVRGAPALIQSTHGNRGNFEVVAPLAGGGLGHWWRNNDASGLPWSGMTRFGSGYVDAVGLIQSNFGPVGNLEVVARIGSKLVHYWRNDGNTWAWSNPIAIN